MSELKDKMKTEWECDTCTFRSSDLCAICLLETATNLQEFLNEREAEMWDTISN